MMEGFILWAEKEKTLDFYNDFKGTSKDIPHTSRYNNKL